MSGYLSAVPRHPLYKEKDVRLSSYGKWSVSNQHDPRSLAEAGFFLSWL